MTTSLRFRADGTFRVLQMADVQDGPHVDPDTVRLIAAAIREADPDLVVFTGDQVRGYDPAWMRTFLRRRGDRIGGHVRAVTRFEARWRRLFGGPNQPGDDVSVVPGDANDANGTTDATDASALLDDARAKVRSCFAGFLAPIVEAGIPFAATYGNHDFQCGILADEQDDIYRSFDGCLNPPADAGDPLAPEAGTFALPILAGDGSDRIAMSVAMVNSGDYATQTLENDDIVDGEPSSHLHHARYALNSRALDLADSDGYGTPSPAALAWLPRVQRELARRNADGRPVPTIAFQHIPPQDFYQCLREVPPLTPNAVEGVRAFAGRCYVLDREVCLPGSVLGESIGCPDVNCGEVDAMREAGGYFALYCGHDHKNAFVGRVGGLDLGYAPTCGFASYGPKARLRGIRLFEFHESDPRAYVTRMLTFGDLVGKHSSNEVRTFIGDHLVTGGPTLRDQLRRPNVFTALALMAGAAASALAHGACRLLRRR